MILAAFAAFIVLAAAFANGCGGSKPRIATQEPASPTATLANAAAPTGAAPVTTSTAQPAGIIVPPAAGVVGPVVVYRRQEPPDEMIVAYDLGVGQELWSVRARSGDQIASVAVGGDLLALNTGSKVSLYRFDGKPLEDFLIMADAPTGFEQVAVSDDGTMLAAVRRWPGGPAPGLRWNEALTIYDVASGREIAELSSNDREVAGFGSTFGPLQWRADSEGVFMWGQTNSEKPGDYLTLFLDGNVVRHDLDGAAYLAPNARIAVEGISSLGCLFYSGHNVTLRDLDTGGSLGVVSDQTRAFTGAGWSPDSRQFLFESRPWQADFDCSNRWWAADPDLFVVDLTTGAVQPAASLEEVYRSWYGNQLIWMECAGEFVPPRVHPFGNPKTLNCQTEPGSLNVRGHVIDTGKFIIVAGFIE